MKRNKNLNLPYKVPEPQNEKIKEAVRLGQEYMGSHIPKRRCLLRLFIKQVEYISPTLWIFQFLILVIISALAISGSVNQDKISLILFKAAPLVSLAAVPELMKDVVCGMWELESGCKNNASKLLILRVIGVGVLNISVLSIVCAIASNSFSKNFFELIIYALVPYNCSNIISLFLLQILKIRERISILTVSVISAVLVMYIPEFAFLTVPILAAALVITALIFGFQIAHFIKNTSRGDMLIGTCN